MSYKSYYEDFQMFFFFIFAHRNCHNGVVFYGRSLKAYRQSLELVTVSESLLEILNNDDEKIPTRNLSFLDYNILLNLSTQG